MESDERANLEITEGMKDAFQNVTHQIISASLPQQHSWSFYLQITPLLIPFQIVSGLMNANQTFVSIKETGGVRKRSLKRLYRWHRLLFSWVSISPCRSFSLFVLYKAKAEAKRLKCALLVIAEEVVDESRLLNWGYGTEQR